MEEKPVYETDRLNFAAYLITSGKSKLTGCRPKGDGRTVIFQLSAKPDQDTINRFYSGDGLISAFQYEQTLKMLKGRAIEMRRSEKMRI